jgi:hypothetical protein
VRILLTEFRAGLRSAQPHLCGVFPERSPIGTHVGLTHLARGGIVKIDMIAYRPESCHGGGLIKAS